MHIKVLIQLLSAISICVALNFFKFKLIPVVYLRCKVTSQLEFTRCRCSVESRSSSRAPNLTALFEA